MWFVLRHEFDERLTSFLRGLYFFSRMFDEYHSLTHEVERLQKDELPVADFTIEEMKKVRVPLKDKMYRILVAHKNSY